MATNRDYGGGIWGYTNALDSLSAWDRRAAENGGVIPSLGYTTSSIPTWDNASDLLQKNEGFIRSMGYGGPIFNDVYGYGSEGGGGVSQEFQQWAKENGIVAGKSEPEGRFGGGQSAHAWSLFDANSGQPVGQSTAVANQHTADLAAMASIIAAPVAAAYLGPLLGAAGAGAEAGAGALGAAEAGGAAAGASQIWTPALIDSALGTAGYGASSAGLGGLAGAGAAGLGEYALAGNQVGALGGGGAAGEGGLLGAGAATSTLDPVLITGTSAGAGAGTGLTTGEILGGIGAAGGGLSALNGGTTAPGYSASQNYGEGMTGNQTGAYDTALDLTGSKDLANLVGQIGGGLGSVSDLVGGGQNLAGLIGGAVGGATGGGDQTATSQNLVDPRLAQYLYGSGYGDTNSLLGAAQQQWQQNKTGITPAMQEAIDKQRAVLNNPAYSAGYESMRTQGQGLLSTPIASNPFTSQSMSQAGGSGGLLNSPNAQTLMARGRGLLG